MRNASPPDHDAGRAGPFRRIAAGLLAAVVVATAFTSAGLAVEAETSAAQAAPGSPGVPAPAPVLYEENFENAQGRALTDVIPLQSYQSAQGVTYTADPFWLDTSACNGFIMNFQSLRPAGYCSDSASQFGDALAKSYALGLLNSPQNPTSNWAVSSNTSGMGTDNERMFVSSLLNVPANGRFITFSVDSAATACFAVQPKLQFSLVTAAGQLIPVSNAPINPCTNPNRQEVDVLAPGSLNNRVAYGRFSADSSILFNSNQLGISMVNLEGTGGGNDGAFDNIRVLDVTPQLDKSFAPQSVPVGGVSTLTFTVTATTAQSAVSGWQFTDNLPSGLVVADNANIGGTCDATTTAAPGATSIDITDGSLAANEPFCTITVDVTSDVPRGADPSPVTYENCAANISNQIGIDDPACATVEFFSEPKLSIEKTSDAGQDARVGQTVSYEVQVTNTGTADFSTANPASFSDDLSRVLDNAEWNDDATVAFSDGSTGDVPTLTDNTLNWSGPLKVGETATFTYSVTLTNAGDGSVVNNACVPEELASEDDNCATTTTELPKLTIAKTSNTAELPTNGGTVTYEVTVTNQGPGDATADNPASFEDDLSDVLDDGDFVDGSLSATSGTPARDGNDLTWSGLLAAGDSVTVTYQVAYDANKGGTNQLVNVACLPVDLAQDPENPCREVQIPGAALQQWKTADPASGNVVTGDEITYTLHFRNTGQAAAIVDNSDDLSAVIDDADLTAGPTSSNAGLTATLDGNVVQVSGSVAAGAEYTVSYTVQVRAEADRGDSILTNALAQCDANNSALCDPIEHRIPHLTVEKFSGVETARTGDTVTYTIEVTNDGTGAYTAANPASFTDDLTGVLDDASYNEDAEATSGTVSYSEPTLSWEGALAAGDSATVTYTVTVTNAGDHQLLNTACVPNAGEEPTCDANTVLLPHFVVSKSVDPESGTKVDAGQVVTYTLSFGNDGTAPGDIDYTDNLSDVLDDAVFGDGPTASDAALAAVRDGERIGVTGNLAVDQTVTVTYSVTVKADGERGNNVLGNVLADSDNPNPTCGDDGVSCTENPIGELVTWKTVDPASGTTVREGDTATYTLHFENTGKAPVDVARDDVLTDVLDDADVTTQPAASSDALTVSAIIDGRFTVTGTLAPGATVTVTYTVTVKAEGARGDDRLGNFLVPQGENPPAECVAVPDELPNCTVNPVSDVAVTKSADPESGTKVNAGQDVTYTLTFTNRSESSDSAPAAIDYTDHMQDVLDDATLTAGPTASSGDLTAVSEGNTIRITGGVPYGAVYTVSYTVKVKSYAEQGNHQLGNVVAVTGEDPVCAPGSPLCTEHPAAPPTPLLPITGGEMLTAGLWSTLVLLLTGGAIVWVARRRDRETLAQLTASRELKE